MSSKHLLNKKIPLIDDNHTTEDVVNYLVKTINSTFVDGNNSTSSSTDFARLLGGLNFSQAYSITIPGGAPSSITSSYGFTHNFGSLPSGYIVTMVTSNASALGIGPVVVLGGWTNTTVTINTIGYGGGLTISGTFNFTLLR